MRTIVAGGGIGGVALGAALAREGIEPVILEQAPELTEIGAGLQISANGARALEYLGLEAALAPDAVAAEGIEWRRLDDGERVYRIPLGARAAERYGATFYQAHRADLLAGLVGALPPHSIRLGAQVQDFRQNSHGVTVHLSSGDEVHGDALVAADGLRSPIRQRLFGPDDPRFSGLLAWRALIPYERAAELGLGHQCYGWFGADRSVVVYWIRPRRLFNFIGFVPTHEVRRESWTQSGDVTELQASFTGATDVVQRMVGMIDEAFITGVYFRDPLDRWSDGRVTLLGDAAHPMSPFLAQGACTAMEDAIVLARSLARGGVDRVPETFVEYERRRIPRTSKMQAYSRAAERFWHEADPVQEQARDGRFRGLERLDPLAEMITGWIYDHDPVHAADAPVEHVRGLGAARVGKRMLRPIAQRACDLWMSALTAEDHSGGWLGLRAGYERMLETHCPVPPDAVVEEIDAHGVRCLLVGSTDRPDDPVVMHLHGGGFMLGSADSSLELGLRLARAAGGRCLVVDYRLAPEHAYPAALDDCRTAYAWLLEHGVDPGRIVITGESAGGGLALSVALACREGGEPLPALLYLMSPLADLTVSGCTVDAREGDDPVVNRDLLTDMSASYLQGHDPRDPLASPVFADYSGFPPMLVHAASDEALLSDAIRVVQAARDDGVRARLELFDDSVHIVPLLNFLPEAAVAIGRFAAFAAVNLNRTLEYPQGTR